MWLEQDRELLLKNCSKGSYRGLFQRIVSIFLQTVHNYRQL